MNEEHLPEKVVFNKNIVDSLILKFSSGEKIILLKLVPQNNNKQNKINQQIKIK